MSHFTAAPDPPRIADAHMLDDNRERCAKCGKLFINWKSLERCEKEPDNAQA